MILYMIRHGDPDYATDSLTEKGRLQAELVGKRLFDAGIDRVFSSPLGRARQTAEPLLESFDKTFSKVFCDPTATRWSPAHGRNTPTPRPLRM